MNFGLKNYCDLNKPATMCVVVAITLNPGAIVLAKTLSPCVNKTFSRSESPVNKGQSVLRETVT
jgi:hypothetical protein